MATIETKVADAILQKANEVTVCGRTFEVTPPTPATLIMVSKYASELPQMNGDNVFNEIIAKAKDAEPLGKIAAILILGAKRIKENRTVKTGLFRKKKEIDWLSEHLLEEVSTAELAQILTQRLMDMEVADFFAITTSLSAANLTKKTKEVEIVSGAR